MIVADANLVAYLLLPGEHTEAAERVLDRDPEWIAPVLCLSELRNILAVTARSGRITRRMALGSMARAEGLLEGRMAEPDSARVLALAIESGCSAYDCEYVALAKLLGVPLVTSDHKLVEAFPDVAVHPERWLPPPHADPPSQGGHSAI